MSPKRIQRKRTRGWRMPKGAVNVARPGFWGNPFRGPRAFERYCMVWQGRWQTLEAEGVGYLERQYLACLLEMWKRRLHELRGKILVCWCPLDRECHGDILLKKANR